MGARLRRGAVRIWPLLLVLALLVLSGGVLAQDGGEPAQAITLGGASMTISLSDLTLPAGLALGLWSLAREAGRQLRDWASSWRPCVRVELVSPPEERDR